MELNGQEVLSGVEHEFHDSRYQAANRVKYRASEGGSAEMDDGAPGRRRNCPLQNHFSFYSAFPL